MRRSGFGLLGLACAAGLCGPAFAYDVPDSVLKGRISGACITIEEQFVGFGEETTRGDAIRKLDEAIAVLRLRRSRFAEATEKSRSVSCSVYIKWMNEFECTATATLCR
jgi:hypothetical protein